MRRSTTATSPVRRLSRNSTPATSFPYVPVLDAAEENLKVPDWLNDPTLYHNRGDTTFVGEDSYYGDFFGLDDLFTEHPKVVDGMEEIYKTWIGDFGVDGFRIDTMKHVNNEFWQEFGPEVLSYAKAQGKDEFFMFGEVFDTTKSFTSQFTTRNQMQAVLDFPFQDAARSFASKSQDARTLETFFAGDDWYTDADSNVYQLPTFLGNHDMGRIGSFIAADNPGSTDAEQVARDQLAHELMYFSRGNPVIYYGDEQGFTGPGGDQDARQTLFASQVPEYLDDDLLGTDATHATDNFNAGHPLYSKISQLAALTKEHPALRDGAHQHRYASEGPGIYAFSRTDAEDQREYVVALNNSEQPQTAEVPTYIGKRNYTRIYGDARRGSQDLGGRQADGHRPAAVRRGLRVVGPHPALQGGSRRRTPGTCRGTRGQRPDQGNGRRRRCFVLRGHLRGEDSRRWLGTDRHRRHRAVPGVPRRRGFGCRHRRRIPRHRAGQRRPHRHQPSRTAAVPAPVLTMQKPVEGSNVEGLGGAQRHGRSGKGQPRGVLRTQRGTVASGRPWAPTIPRRCTR